MPLVKSDPDYWRKVAKTRIQTAIWETGHQQQDLTDVLHITASGLSYKIRKMTMSLEDFSLIADALDWDDETILKIVRR